MDRYAVFGNPVRHSKSPRIHHAFARQCRQDMQYRAVVVERGGFARAADRFFDGGGSGLNVTLPCKGEACRYADELSPQAERAGAANTLTKTTGGRIQGDNTDGLGLIRDLVDNLGWEIGGRRVLVLGAGGAVRGVLELLLEEKPALLAIANRTAATARNLAAHFADLGPARGGGFEQLAGQQFDLVINGTAASLTGELPTLPADLLSEGSCCYDMMYAARPTVFMRWAKSNGAESVADGLGMLVEQAAESFYLWRRKHPQTAPVIAAVRREMQG